MAVDVQAQDLLLPWWSGVVGAGAGIAYARSAVPGDPLDDTSFAIGGSALALGVSEAVGYFRGVPNPANTIGFSAVLLSLIAYDRWHDGMWPFTERGKLVVRAEQLG